PREGDALDPYSGPPADPHPDRAAGDRGARPTLQDRVQVVGSRIATSGPPQVEAGPEKGGDSVRGPLGDLAVHLVGEVVEQAQPGPRVDGGGVLDGDPEGRLGDVGGGSAAAARTRLRASAGSMAGYDARPGAPHRPEGGIRANTLG